jgi:hypothetical protein
MSWTACASSRRRGTDPITTKQFLTYDNPPTFPLGAFVVIITALSSAYTTLPSTSAPSDAATNSPRPAACMQSTFIWPTLSAAAVLLDRPNTADPSRPTVCRSESHRVWWRLSFQEG